MKDVKVICCDMDGTLLRDDKSLSEENKYWIKRAVDEKGIKFVLVSGRILRSLDHFKTILGIRGLTSSLNGTYLTDENDKVLASHTIDKSLAEIVVSVHKAHKAEILAIGGNTWYSQSHSGYLYAKKRPIYLSDSVQMEMDEVVDSVKVNKFVFMSPDKTELDKIEKDLKNRIKNPDDLYFYPSADFLEIMPGGINKGAAVDDMISYYNIDRSQVMAFGDDINDVEMLQKAGIGVAMGNALECAKKAASVITDTNQNDGVAKAIKEIVFNE